MDCGAASRFFWPSQKALVAISAGLSAHTLVTSRGSVPGNIHAPVSILLSCPSGKFSHSYPWQCRRVSVTGFSTWISPGHRHCSLLAAHQNHMGSFDKGNVCSNSPADVREQTGLKTTFEVTCELTRSLVLVVSECLWSTQCEPDSLLGIGIATEQALCSWGLYARLTRWTASLELCSPRGRE